LIHTEVMYILQHTCAMATISHRVGWDKYVDCQICNSTVLCSPIVLASN
jgi:hypothetical protein